jgi:phosphotransferase system IIB component
MKSIEKQTIESDDEYLEGYDCSGSTGISCYCFKRFDCSCGVNSKNNNISFYHKKTQEIERTVLEGKKVTRTRWDDSIHEISKSELEWINRTKRGYNGTNPEVLVDYIINKKFHGNLVLISDGQIGSNTVQRCSEKLKEWKFKKVFIYLIGTGFNIEESISCAFTRNSPHVIEIYNSNGTLKQDVIEITNESFGILDKIDSISDEDEFMAIVPELDNLLASINMGTSGNSQIKDNMVKLKNRIIKNKSNNVGGISEISDLILNPNLENLTRVWSLYYYGSSSIWEKTIDKYISWCSGALLNSFNRNNINREIKAIVKPPEPPQIIEITETTESSIVSECPILLDNSCNMMILVRKKDSLFNYIKDNKDAKESLTNCPLIASNYPNVLSYIKGMMDNVISIEAYKELIEHGISDQSPLTKEEIIGGICLGSHHSHVKFSNSVLRKALTNGKCLGNIDLWFAVIYLMVKNGLVPHLDDYLPNIKEHMIYRLEKSTTYMCLSGLPTYPTYRVPLKVALWSILSASKVADDTKQEPIRLHLSYASDILYLFSVAGLCAPEGIEEYINRLKCLRFLLNQKKKGDKDEIENIAEAAGQNFIQLSNGRFVFIDGIPTEEQIRVVKKKLPGIFEFIPREDILYLNKICDKNKSESDIPYNINTKPIGVKIGSANWEYKADMPYCKVDICEATCRPFYYVDGGSKKWMEKAKEIYGEGELLSSNKIFGSYICKNKKYPTKEEFLVYLSKYFERREKKTLPVCINQFLNELYEEYKEIIEKVSVEDFIKRWKNSSEIANRIEMEKNSK